MMADLLYILIGTIICLIVLFCLFVFLEKYGEAILIKLGILDDLARVQIYRVYSPKDARNFPQGVYELQRYEAFVVVSATPDAVSELRKRCPVEPLEYENDLKLVSRDYFQVAS